MKSIEIDLTKLICVQEDIAVMHNKFNLFDVFVKKPKKYFRVFFKAKFYEKKFNP